MRRYIGSKLNVMFHELCRKLRQCYQCTSRAHRTVARFAETTRPAVNIIPPGISLAHIWVLSIRSRLRVGGYPNFTPNFSTAVARVTPGTLLTNTRPAIFLCSVNNHAFSRVRPEPLKEKVAKRGKSTPLTC